VILHVARTDLSPAHDRLSEYANGAYGGVMTLSFFTLGAGIVLLGLMLPSSGPRHGWRRVVRFAVVGAGCGMVLSGLYRTDPDGAPTTSERVHSLASGAATMALIAAAVSSLFLAHAGSPRRASVPAGALAGAAVALGAISPVLHETAWTGLGQRALWLTLMAWLLLTAWQQAPVAPAVAAGQGRSSTRPKARRLSM
jgi:hypothetical protein